MSRFDGGFVQLFRSDVMGPIGKRGIETLGLWGKLLAFASRYEIKIPGGSIFPEGSVVTSLSDLADSTDERVVSKVRRDLAFLESLGKIKQQIVVGGRVISLLTWTTNGVENTEKEPKIRQAFDQESAVSEHKNDIPELNASHQHSLRNGDDRFDATEHQQANDRSSAEDRTLNGIKNKNKTNNNTNTQTSNPSDPGCALLEIWNQNRGRLPRATLTAIRKTKALARLKDQPDLQYWTQIVKTLAESPFCNAKTGGTWRADFDFLLKPDTHVKASEGKYGLFGPTDSCPPDSPGQPSPSSLERSEQLAQEEQAQFAESRRRFELFDAEFNTEERRAQAIEKYAKHKGGKLAYLSAVVVWFSEVYNASASQGGAA